jgi:hypothetical protein
MTATSANRPPVRTVFSIWWTTNAASSDSSYASKSWMPAPWPASVHSALGVRCGLRLMIAWAASRIVCVER